MVFVQTQGISDPKAGDSGDQLRALASDSEKKGLKFQRVVRKFTGQDPRRVAILARIGSVFRHLPPSGLLLFFDVQPIAVKAYGGRRYSSQEKLILERGQKTRGFFYLFAAYNVTTGRVLWSFMPGKGSRYVCQFFRKVRRHFPSNSIQIVLDRDPAHPIKSKITRRLFRQLHLRWISLPKGSPDDNPVETLFSNIQLMILDNSNDRLPRDTRRRITRFFRGRNQRLDRRIRIHYLSGSNKK